MTGCVRLAWEVDEGKAGCVRGQVGENMAECLVLPQAQMQGTADLGNGNSFLELIFKRLLLILMFSFDLT